MNERQAAEESGHDETDVVFSDAQKQSHGEDVVRKVFYQIDRIATFKQRLKAIRPLLGSTTGHDVYKSMVYD